MFTLFKPWTAKEVRLLVTPNETADFSWHFYVLIRDTKSQKAARLALLEMAVTVLFFQRGA